MQADTSDTSGWSQMASSDQAKAGPPKIVRALGCRANCSALSETANLVPGRPHPDRAHQLSFDARKIK